MKYLFKKRQQLFLKVLSILFNPLIPSLNPPLFDGLFSIFITTWLSSKIKLKSSTF